MTTSEEDRRRTLAEARAHNRPQIEQMTPLKRERWTAFVTEAQEKCPRVREDDIVKLSEIMANLELSRSGYDLLHQLSQYGPDELDDLHRLLEEWTLDMAKIVLDEIAQRLKLVGELEVKVRDARSREVQDLQPLFKRGLWIFGPEYETIEYTSNVGMTRVIQDLFHAEGRGSSRRPDFVVLPDSTVGIYSYPRFDVDDGGEIGVERLVIVELKRPGIRIGSSEKEQCWVYVKELLERGLIQDRRTSVMCFLLGSEFDPVEGDDRTERGNTVIIRPLAYEAVLGRAKGRMLKLHDRVREAPFLMEHRDEIERFLQGTPPQTGQSEMALG